MNWMFVRTRLQTTAKGNSCLTQETTYEELRRLRELTDSCVFIEAALVSGARHNPGSVLKVSDSLSNPKNNSKAGSE